MFLNYYVEGLIIVILTAHIGLSYKCNMHCKHCFVNRYVENDVFYNNYKEILDKLYEKGLCVLFYTYGEPLLSEHFFEVAQYAAQKHLCQILMTNGYYISDNSVVKRIRSVGIKQILISIDSADKAKHDTNRGKEGAWEHAMRAIELAKQQDVIVGIACTITNENYHEIEEIYSIALKKNVDIVSFLRCREDGVLEVLDDIEEYVSQIGNLILRSTHDGIKVMFHDVELIPMLKDLYTQKLLPEEAFNSYVAMCQCTKATNINIAPNGDVYSCDFSLYPIGNCKQESLDTILLRKDPTCSCMRNIVL